MKENKLDIVLNYYQEEFLAAEGFDDAIIGVSDNKLVYSMQRCIEILMIRDGMDMEEAIEYFDFNVSSAYMGEKTPIWVEDMFWSE